MRRREKEGKKGGTQLVLGPGGEVARDGGLVGRRPDARLEAALDPVPPEGVLGVLGRGRVGVHEHGEVLAALGVFLYFVRC